MNPHIVRSVLCVATLGWTASCAAVDDPDLPEGEADEIEEGELVEVDDGTPTVPKITEAERIPAPPLQSNLRAGCPFRSDYVTSVTLGEGYWGAWPECFSWCPEAQGRSFAYSLWLRSEPSQGSNDDTGLNAVALDCYNQSDWAYRGYIESFVQFFGNWTAAAVCDTHPIMGGEMKIESPQGGGDDTAANDLDALCANGQHLNPQTYTSWGTWRGFVGCPPGTAVCGMKTRVESKLGGGDDTALNGVQFACCNF
jgi:hypothetical protein